MKRRIAILAAWVPLLAGCATAPVVNAFTLSPAFRTSEERTFAFVPTDNPDAQAVLPVVERRLRELGYRRTDNPALLVDVGMAMRSRRIGAFVPEGTGGQTWLTPPLEKRQAHRRNVRTLTVRILQARGQQPVYSGAATISASRGSPVKSDETLVGTLLHGDPRMAPLAATGTN